MTLFEDRIREINKRWKSLSPSNYEDGKLQTAKRLVERIFADVPKRDQIWMCCLLLDSHLQIVQTNPHSLFGFLMRHSGWKDSEKLSFCSILVEDPYPIEARYVMGRKEYQTYCEDQRQAAVRALELMKSREEDLMNRFRKSARIIDIENIAEGFMNEVTREAGLTARLGFDNWNSPRMCHAPEAVFRCAAVWKIRLDGWSPSEAMEWCFRAFQAKSAKRKTGRSARSDEEEKERDRYPYDQDSYVEAVTDILLLYRNDFPSEAIRATLEVLRLSTWLKSRLAAYRVGAILLGKEFARPGLDDPAKLVASKCRGWLEKGASDIPPAYL